VSYNAREDKLNGEKEEVVGRGKRELATPYDVTLSAEATVPGSEEHCLERALPPSYYSCISIYRNKVSIKALNVVKQYRIPRRPSSPPYPHLAVSISPIPLIPPSIHEIEQTLPMGIFDPSCYTVLPDTVMRAHPRILSKSTLQFPESGIIS
jgi:hypothetical protein